jgi:hypothetical protein
MSNWGGKRAGAGRKRNPNSQRALAAQMHISSYTYREGRKIGRIAGQFGIAGLLYDLLDDEAISLCQARRLCRVAAFDAEQGTHLLQWTCDAAKTKGWAKAIQPMWRKPRPNLF